MNVLFQAMTMESQVGVGQTGILQSTTLRFREEDMGMALPKSPMRDVGGMGEKTFEAWCSEVGIVANKSQIDMTGWDYLVEFPVERTGEWPADLTPSPVECRIQVKSSDKSRKRLNINLKNMERLAKTPMPTFICVFEFDGKSSPQRVYLIHVAEDIIRRTLTRLRKQEMPREANTRHPSLSLTYGDSERLNSPRAICLKETIESYVPNGIAEYQVWKTRVLAGLGYEKGYGHVTVKIVGQDPLGDLSDLSLGLRESLEVKSVAVYDSRFGINRLLRRCTEGAKVSLKPTVLTGSVRFRERRSSVGIEFPASVHNPSINTVAPRERIRFRLETELFDILIEPFKGLARLEFLSGLDQKRLNLRTLKDLLALQCLLGNDQSQSILMDVNVDGKPFLPEGRLFCPGIHMPKTELDMAREMIRVASIYEVDGSISMCLHELAESSRSVSSFYRMVEGLDEDITITFAVDEALGLTCEGGIVLRVFVPMGEHLLYSVFGIIGPFERIGRKQYRLASHNKAFHKRGVIPSDSGIDATEMEELAADVERDMEANGIHPVIVLSENWDAATFTSKPG